MEKINEFLNNNNLTTLKRSYMDACSNEEFSSFISTIDASDEVLMKYTSTLEEAMCEYINCKNCKNILTCKNKVEGFCYKPEVVDNTLQFSYVMCKKKRDLEDAQSYLKNIKYYEMSKDIVNASFKDLYILPFPSEASFINLFWSITMLPSSLTIGTFPCLKNFTLFSS